MCGCLSSKVEKDSSARYGDSRYYHCKRREQNWTSRSHRYVADTEAGGDPNEIVLDHFDSGRRDSGGDVHICDTFIGDIGGDRRHGIDCHVGNHDINPICKYYDVDHQRRDCDCFIAYHGDISIGQYLAVRHVDSGSYFEL